MQPPSAPRVPTAWTRPMQLGASALLVAAAIRAIVAPIVEGRAITTSFSVVVLVFAVLALFAAVGSFLGWRWMFWPAAVYFVLVAGSAVTNVSVLLRTDFSRTQLPLAYWLVNEAIALVILVFVAWMAYGLTKFGGPWAMKKPAG